MASLRRIALGVAAPIGVIVLAIAICFVLLAVTSRPQPPQRFDCSGHTSLSC